MYPERLNECRDPKDDRDIKNVRANNVSECNVRLASQRCREANAEFRRTRSESDDGQTRNQGRNPDSRRKARASSHQSLCPEIE